MNSNKLLRSKKAMWKYWFVLFGWKINATFHASRLSHIPLVGHLWFWLKRVTARLLTTGKGAPACVKGENFYLYPLSAIYTLKDYEPYTTELFLEVVKRGFTVLDIGAHHGYFSLLAARKVGNEGKVYAFEPAPENFKILKRNIELNRLTNVHAVNKAVGDRCATASFFISKSSGQCALYPGPDNLPVASVLVEMITIDGFLSDKPVDVIKMDIEGGEPAALEGMRRTLGLSKEVVLFVEFNPNTLTTAKVEPKAFLNQLKQQGFEIQIINERRRCLQPIEQIEKALQEQVVNYVNLYCVKRFFPKVG